MKKTTFILGIIGATITCTIRVKAQDINLYAGVVSTGAFSGDGGPATAAYFNQITGITTDANGNIYVADQYNNEIRMISKSTGIITSVAGNGYLAGTGNGGYTGDGGPTTAAELAFPYGVKVDGNGNIFFTDCGNEVIRKVSSSGIITTIAGNNAKGNGYSGDGGPATDAELNGPQGLAYDAFGNIYFADTYNNIIREVTSTGTITTVAGHHVLIGGFGGDGGLATAALLNYPYDVTVDNYDDLYIADNGNNVIRYVNSTTGIISTVAGNYALSPTGGYSGDGGIATNAELNGPQGITVDNSGNMYIADFTNDIVREVNYSSGIINTIAGIPQYGGFSGDGGLATLAELHEPSRITTTVKEMYIADWGNNVVRVVNLTTGINEVTDKNDVTIYPNPAKDNLYIQVQNFSTATLLDLYTITGQKVMEMKTGGKQFIQLSTAGFSSGIYFLRVEFIDGNSSFSKIEINK